MTEAAEGARDGLTAVTKGALIMLLGTLGLVAENFIAQVLLAHSLTTDQWSDFRLGLALTGLLATLGALGLPSAVARNLPYTGREDERRGIVRVAFTVGIPAAVVVAAVLFLVGFPVGASDPLFGLTMQLFAGALFFGLVSGLIASVFQGYEDVYPNAIFVQILTPSLFLAFLATAWLLPTGGSYYTFALVGYVVANLVTLLSLVAYARRRLPRHLTPGPVAPGVSRRLLLFALPLFAVGIFSYLTQNADTLLLGVFDRSLVAFYNAPLLLARLLQVGLGSLAFIFLPVTARFVRDGKRDAVRVTYTTTTKWIVLTSLPLFLVFFFAPVRSLGFVFGPNYTGANEALQIVVTGAFLSTVVGPAVAAQVSFGRTWLLFYNAAAAAGANVLLSLLFIPLYGVLGAAIAWAVANALFTTLSAVELAVLDHVHPFQRHYVLPLLLTLVPLSVLLAVLNLSLPLWSLPAVVIGIGVFYFFAVVLSRSVDEGDRMLLEVIERFIGRRIPLIRRIGRYGMPRAPPPS